MVLGEMKKRETIKGYPTRHEGGHGGEDVCYIETQTKTARKVRHCSWCGNEIDPKLDRYVGRAIIHPYVKNDILYKPEGKSTPYLFQLCSDECFSQVLDNVGDGKEFTLRDWIERTRHLNPSNFNPDYYEVLREKFPDKPEKWAREKCLMFFSRCKNHPAHLIKEYFEAYFYSEEDRRRMRNRRWVLPGEEEDVEIEYEKILAWARKGGNFAKLAADIAK